MTGRRGLLLGVMSPDAWSRRKQSRPGRPTISQIRTAPSSDDPHDVAFFRRHRDDDPSQAVPGREFLNSCHVKVRATMRAREAYLQRPVLRWIRKMILLAAKS